MKRAWQTDDSCWTDAYQRKSRVIRHALGCCDQKHQIQPHYTRRQPFSCLFDLPSSFSVLLERSKRKVLPRLLFLFSLLLLLSPWYNRNGWLGVKHQLTYFFFFKLLISSSSSCLFHTELPSSFDHKMYSIHGISHFNNAREMHTEKWSDITR